MKIPNLITGRSARLPGDYGPQGQPKAARSPGATLGAGTVTITVPGTPLGKPRMTQRDKWKKRPCVVRYREWADKVRDAAVMSVPAANRVVSLSWVAIFEPPKSWSKKKRAEAIGTMHREKPDRDNINKAVLDILYPSGDKAIASGRLDKRWGWEAKLIITIETV